MSPDNFLTIAFGAKHVWNLDVGNHGFTNHTKCLSRPHAFGKGTSARSPPRAIPTFVCFFDRTKMMPWRYAAGETAKSTSHPVRQANPHLIVLTFQQRRLVMSYTTSNCPVELSGAELDAVAAGDPLINVSDVNVNANIPVNAAVAAVVLGGAAGALATLPGTINQPNL